MGRTPAYGVMVLLLVAIVASTVGCAIESLPPKLSDAEAYTDGKLAAQVDILKGKIRLRVLGFPTPWQDDEARILETEFGIRLVRVAGCTPDSTLVQQVKGYNEVMAGEIERRYGSGVLKTVSERARVEWQSHESSNGGT